MTLYTKKGVDVFAAVDANGNPRGAVMGEAALWSTEMERAAQARGIVRLGYEGPGWQLYGPDGSEISSSGAPGARANTGLEYARTNGYMFEAIGPSTTSAGAWVAKLTCDAPLVLNPRSYSSIRFKNCTLSFNDFSGNAIKIGVQNGGRVDFDCQVERSGGSSSDVTYLVNPADAEPVYGSPRFQDSVVRFGGCNLSGSSTNQAIVAFVTGANTSNQIINSHFYFGTMDGGPNKSAETAIRINTPSNTDGGIGDCRFIWTLLVGFQKFGLMAGHTTGDPTKPFATNYYAGSIENTSDVGEAGILQYSFGDTFDITSIDVNTGSLDAGIRCKSGATGSRINCGLIVADAGVVLDSGANNNEICVPSNLATTPISDSGTGNHYRYNGRWGGSWPTSASGLPTGTIWNDGGTLKIA